MKSYLRNAKMRSLEREHQADISVENLKMSLNKEWHENLQSDKQ